MQRPFAFLLLFVLSLFAPFALPAAAQPTIDPILPENGRFQLTSRELEVGTVSSNFDFSLTPIALNTAVYPVVDAGRMIW